MQETEILGGSIVANVSEKKGVAGRVRICSAGHPNLQGRSIRFEYPFQVEDTKSDSGQREALGI